MTRTSHLATDIIPDMSLLDLIIEKTGVRIASDSVASDYEAQKLIASLLALVARSDGGISTACFTKMAMLPLEIS